MKKILFAVSMLLAINCFSQTLSYKSDTSGGFWMIPDTCEYNAAVFSKSHPLRFTSAIIYDFTKGWFSSVSYSIDSGTVIGISGDTMEVIQMLVNKIRRLDSIQGQYEKFMAAAVCFSNTVPNDLRESKNNPAWTKYWRLLRKNGYYTYTPKTKSVSAGCH